MPREFKSAISHLALCFSSLYGLERTAGGYMGFTFGVMTLHSVIGVIYYIQTENSENFHKIYRGSRIPIYALSLAPLAAHALSTAGNSAFSIFPMILGVVPSILYIADRAYDETQYAVILANAVSCGFLSFFNQCGYGIIAALENIMAYLCLKDNSDFFDLNPSNTYNFMLCIYIFLAVEAAADSKLGILDL